MILEPTLYSTESSLCFQYSGIRLECSTATMKFVLSLTTKMMLKLGNRFTGAR